VLRPTDQLKVFVRFEFALAETERASSDFGSTTTAEAQLKLQEAQLLAQHRAKLAALEKSREDSDAQLLAAAIAARQEVEKQAAAAAAERQAEHKRKINELDQHERVLKTDLDAQLRQVHYMYEQRSAMKESVGKVGQPA
jgi:hypothetical protein